ncbi:MAG: MFS transporter [Chloroflexota bacterium]
MSGVISTLRSSFSPLRIPNFRIYLGGQAVSLIGTWLQATAQGWVVWELTKSSEALGVVTMLGTLPILLLGLWTGVWADRFDRRKLLIGTQIGAMILAITLAILVQTNSVQLWHVYILSLLLGVVTALDMPAQQAFLGDLSGMSEIRKAVNLNGMIIQVSRLVGPALAGFVVARLGAAPAFWLNGLSFLAVVVSFVAVRSSQVKSTSQGKPLQQAWEGVQFIRTQPPMLDLYIFAGMVVFFVLSIVLSQLPAVASEVLKGDAETLGALMSASGAGALVGVLLIVPLTQAMARSGLVLGLATAWMSIWLLVFPMATTLPFSLISLFFGSMGAPTVLTLALGLVQLMSPAAMRARLLSLFTMVSFGLQPIASLLVGFSAGHFGIQHAIQINAVLLFAGAVIMLVFRGELRRWRVNLGAIQPVPISEGLH